MIDLREIQKDCHRWQKYNFNLTPNQFKLATALGVCEEAGELAHAVLKDVQGIREGADKEKIKDMVGDAVADCTIFGLNICSLYGIDFEKILMYTFSEVMKRDWKKYPGDGLTK